MLGFSLGRLQLLEGTLPAQIRTFHFNQSQVAAWAGPGSRLGSSNGYETQVTAEALGSVCRLGVPEKCTRLDPGEGCVRPGWMGKLNVAQKCTFTLGEQHTPIPGDLGHSNKLPALSQDYLFPGKQKSPLKAVICESDCTFVHVLSHKTRIDQSNVSLKLRILSSFSGVATMDAPL